MDATETVMVHRRHRTYHKALNAVYGQFPDWFIETLSDAESDAIHKAVDELAAALMLAAQRSKPLPERQTS